MRGLPCVQIAPSYLPLASTRCTAVGDRGQRAARRRGGEVVRPIGKEVAPAQLGRDVALADRAFVAGSPCVAAGGAPDRSRCRRATAIRLRRPWSSIAEPVDLLEDARAVRDRTAGAQRSAARQALGAVVLPGLAVAPAPPCRAAGRAPSSGSQRDLVDRHVVRALALAVETRRRDRDSRRAGRRARPRRAPADAR